VSLGAFIFCSSLFSLVVIWRKNYKLIFLSGIFLLIVFVTLIVITTVRLTLNYESTSKLERVKLIAQVSVESLFQLIGIIITFFMSTRKPISQKDTKYSTYTPDIELEDRSFDKRSRRSYNPLSSKDLDNGLDM
jgi:heme/copper-type cytochrome/quinol oxidase subunit 2